MSIHIERIAEGIADEAYTEALEAYPDSDELDNRYEYALDRVHELTDNDEHVIYYSEAWDLVARDMAGVCESAADMMGIDMAHIIKEHGLNNLICTLAYCGIYDAASAMVYDMVYKNDESYGGTD